MRLFLTVFFRAVRPHLWSLTKLACTILVLSTLWILEPLYGRYAIDQMLMIQQGVQVSFYKLIGIWLLLYVAISGTQGLQHYLRWDLLRHVLIETRHHYYRRLLQLDIRHHTEARTGELMKKIDNAADATHTLARQTLIELTPSFLTSFVFFIISFFISWKLALVPVIMVPIYLLITAADVAWTRKHMEKVTKLWVQSMGRGYDAIMNIFTVKSSAAEEREFEKMRSLHEESIISLRKVAVPWAILEGIGYFMLLRIILIGYGILLLIRGEISLGSLFFFQFSFFRLVVPFEMLGNMMPQWNELISKIRLAEELYRQPIDIRNKPSARMLPALRGRIEFKNASFSYGEADAVKDMNLIIEPGEHIALVGHSGAGKSTIAMLLNRFYDVTGGKLLVDGVDIKDLDVHWWRAKVGLVLQENITFNDTIRDNIRYSRPDATDEEIEDAAKRASAHEFISKLPKGYDAMVGERGIRLSGGERQRIAIARAILKKPEIVVLDEATSALDSITEREVQAGIKELIAGRTSVIIAHRLSTVRSVDRIAVMEGGRLVACAPHEELLKISPIYRKMVELQHGGILAEEEERKA